MANIEQFDFKEIPQDRFVMTTWHEDEALREVFWFCKNNAFRPTVESKNTLLLHVGTANREQELARSYAEAQPFHRAAHVKRSAAKRGAVEAHR